MGSSELSMPMVTGTGSEMGLFPLEIKYMLGGNLELLEVTTWEQLLFQLLLLYNMLSQILVA